MTATWLVFTAVCWTAILAVMAWPVRRPKPEPVECRFNGCRRVATTEVWYRHPAGRTTLTLCSTHAERWQAPVFDQELAPGTDLGRWDRQVEG